MTIETTAIITGVAIILVAGAIIAILKHIANSDKHPCKKDIVFSNVCEPKMKAIIDCIETEIEARKEAYKELKETIKTQFTDLKEWIKNSKDE